MNFFGHYFTDSQEGRPWFNLGLVYPDLFRDLYRKQIPNRIVKRDTQSSIDFVDGMRAHIARDKMFHQSSFFLHAEKKLKVVYDEYRIQNKLPRTWFMFHILSELLIDRQLVQAYSEVANRLYLDMANTMLDTLIVDELFEDVVIKTVFLSRMGLIHQDKFIFAYANNEKLIAALWMLYKRAGIELSMELKETHTPILHSIINKLEGDSHFDWAYYTKQL